MRWGRLLRRGAGAAAAGGAAATGYTLSFPHAPHARERADGRTEIDWGALRPPQVVQAFNAAARACGARLMPTDADELVAAAQRRTGLHDFGDEEALPFREGLRLFVEACDDDQWQPFWHVTVKEQVIQYLSTRLKVQQLVTEHPEILDEQVEAPVFIVGMLRTGTTHLLKVLSAHPDLRCLPLYEAMDPVRPSTGADNRLRDCEFGMKLNDWLMPQFKRMHELEPRAAHECIWVFATSFSSLVLESMVCNARYRDWYESVDQAPAYRHFKVMLQVMQWQDRQAHPDPASYTPRRWLLKTPMHAELQPALMRVFPDAYIVATLRDPISIARSWLTLSSYANTVSARLDPGAAPRVAEYWLPRLERMLRRSIDGRAAVPAAQLVDVHFADLVADNYAAARRVCGECAVPVGAGAEAAMRAAIADRPRGKHGALHYSLAPLGIDDDATRERLDFYRQFFDIKAER